MSKSKGAISIWWSKFFTLPVAQRRDLRRPCNYQWHNCADINTALDIEYRISLLLLWLALSVSQWGFVVMNISSSFDLQCLASPSGLVWDARMILARLVCPCSSEAHSLDSDMPYQLVSTQETFLSRPAIKVSKSSPDDNTACKGHDDKSKRFLAPKVKCLGQIELWYRYCWAVDRGWRDKTLEGSRVPWCSKMISHNTCRPVKLRRAE